MLAIMDRFKSSGSIKEDEQIDYRSKLDKHLLRIDAEDILRLNRVKYSGWIKSARARGADNVLISSLGFLDYIMEDEFIKGGTVWQTIMWKVSYIHSEWLEMANDIGIYLKNTGPEHLRSLYLELNALTGYYNVDDYDPLPAIYALCNYRAYNRGPLSRQDYQKKVDSVDIYPAHGDRFIDYLSSGVYTTGGASDMARTELIVNGDKIDIKGKKTLIPIVREAVDIYNECKECTNFVCKANVKPELGKRRFFVAQNDEGYLIQAFILKIAGKFYKDLKGITLDETGSEEQTRNEDMMAGTRGRWVLPFDYKQFDNQISKWEVLVIAKHIADKVEPYLAAEDKWMYSAFIRSIKNAYVLVTYNNLNLEIRYENGLLSGMRITSVIGNLWNWIMTSEVVSTLPVDYWLRGDDSYLTSVSRRALELVEKRYDTYNVEGNKLKYSIRYEQGEFLRNQYSTNEIYGIVPRAVIACTERKPWNSNPIEKYGKAKQFFGNVGTLLRRLGIKFSDSVMYKCARLFKLKNGYVDGMFTLGSLGVTSKYYSGLAIYEKPVLQCSSIVSQSYISNIKEQVDIVEVTDEEARILAFSREAGLLTVDNLTKVHVDINEKMVPYKARLSNKLILPRELYLTKNLCNPTSYPLAQEIAILKGGSAFSWLRKIDIILANMLVQYEEAGCTRKEALSHLTAYSGPIPVAIPGRLMYLVGSIVLENAMHLNKHQLSSTYWMAGLSLVRYNILDTNMW